MTKVKHKPCSKCGQSRFKTIKKGKTYECRLCGRRVNKRGE